MDPSPGLSSTLDGTRPTMKAEQFEQVLDYFSVLVRSLPFDLLMETRLDLFDRFPASPERAELLDLVDGEIALRRAGQ